jgi:hypothetical protein
MEFSILRVSIFISLDVELVLVRPVQARSIASFMLQTKLSIKVYKISLLRIL